MKIFTIFFTKIKLGKNLRILFLLFILFISAHTSYADGTKQVMPDPNNGVAILINDNGLGGPFLNAPAYQRIYFRIDDFSNEQFYFGFQPRERGGIGLSAITYYVIKDPSGNIVSGPTLVDSSSNGFINDYDEAIAGPNIGGATPGGYNPEIFDPSGVGVNGDYYIEIYKSEDGGVTRSLTGNDLMLTFFDFTISDTLNNQIDGRVFCQKWSFITYDPATFTGSINFDFKGSFHAYTDDGAIIKVEFQPGFRPFGYQLAMNKYGVVNDDDAVNDFLTTRRSITYGTDPQPTLAGGYPVFITAPDQNVFVPTTTTAPSLIGGVYGCPGQYYVPFYLNEAGDVSILLNFNGVSGYQSGTEDVVLEAYELTQGNHVISWNGIDGLGNPVAGDTSTEVTLTNYRGRTNLPMNDAELNNNGLSISGVAPLVGNLEIRWDDSGITTFGAICDNEVVNQSNNLTTGGINRSGLLDGILGPSHAWNGSNPNTTVPATAGISEGDNTENLCDDYGNTRVINSWFYGDQASSQPQVITLPTCDVDGDGIVDSADLDDDNDGIEDSVDLNGLDPDSDIDSDGIPDYIDGDTAGFIDSNFDGVDDRYDFDLDGVINNFDLDSDNDGIYDVVESGNGGLDTNNDGVISITGAGAEAPDGNSNGQADPTEGTTPVDTDTNANDNADFLDIDADDDGIPDNVEGQTTTSYFAPLGTDSDNDGIDDQYDVDFAGNNAFAVENTDGDTNPDYIDTDSDGDGESDTIEAGVGTFANQDTDGDGLDDGFEGLDVADGPDVNNELDSGASATNNNDITTTPEVDFREFTDTDGDAITDLVDEDDDNDGITDIVESGGVDPRADVDGDGVPVYLDDDDNNISIGDVNGVVEAPFDFDGDGVANHLDLDSDNDGIPDNIEAQTTAGYIVPNGTVNGTGIDINYTNGLTPVNSDGVDTSDYLDINSDNSGTYDTIEAGLNNTGGTIDTDNDGLLDQFENGTINDGYNVNDGITDPSSEYPDTDSDLGSGGDVDYRDAINDAGVINCGIINAFYQTRGNAGTNEAEVYRYNRFLGEYTLVGVLEGVPANSARNSAYNSIEQKVYSQFRGSNTLRVYDPFNNFGFLGTIELETTPGNAPSQPMDAVMFSQNQSVGYINGDTLFLFDVTGVPLSTTNNTIVTTTEIPLSPSINTAFDYAFIGDFIYGITRGNLQVINASTGATQSLAINFQGTMGGTAPGNAFGAVWQDRFGNFYGSSNGNGEIYRILDVENAVASGDPIIATSILASVPSTRNDGFGCEQQSNPLDWDDDGIEDSVDIDDDNDGILDVDEDLNFDNDNDPLTDQTDTDGDMIPDAYDLDSDGDGIPDNIEAQTTFGYIAPNGVYTSQGLDTAYPGGIDPVNTDGSFSNSDSVFDFRDLDSDNDGLLDTDEAQIILTNNDTDFDGLDDAIDVTNDRTDVNGSLNDPTTLPNSDADNDVDYRDNQDFDDDGILDVSDLDDDNDGITDVIESGGVDPRADIDGDGVPVYLDDDDNDALVGNVNGVVESAFDFDGDGVANYLDLDSDNDGIYDVVEAGGTPSGTNPEEADGAVGPNGIPASAGTGLNPINTDNNTNDNADFLDIDADDDGIPDNVEGQPTANYNAPLGTDSDNDGIDDQYDVDFPGNFAFIPENTDGDADPDYIDTDSDGDGESDTVEAGIGTFANQDTDGDGLDNGFEGGTANDPFDVNDELDNGASDTNNNDIASTAEVDFREFTDTDGDTINDLVDEDDDNDGITDIVESGGVDPRADVDGDGVPVYLDDDDNDALTGDVNGVVENAFDFDGDGVANHLDLDSDNDGIYDVVEAGGTPSAVNPGQADGAADANGIPASAGAGLNPRDTQSNGSLDYLNLDSDNDGCSDANEAYGTPTADGGDNGVFGAGTPAVNTDGTVNDPAATYATPADSDSDTVADYRQVGGPDRDSDGISDACDPEINDVDGDGIGDAVDLDDDNDGIADDEECDVVNSSLDWDTASWTGNPTDDPDMTALTTIGTNLLTVDNSNTDNSIDNTIYDALYAKFNNVLDGIQIQGQLNGFNNGNTIRYKINFAEPVLGLRFTIVDIDKKEGAEAFVDQVRILATNQGTPINLIKGENYKNGNAVDDLGGGVFQGNRQVEIGRNADVDVFLTGYVDEIIIEFTNLEIAQSSGATAIAISDLKWDCDFDGDGIANRLDLDSDNDGIYDVVEAGGTPSGTNPEEADGAVDANGIPASAGTGLNPINTDSNTNDNADFLDIDADDDGIPDNVEGQPTANYNAPLGTDSDNDGIDDQYDVDFLGNFAFTPENTDGDADPDYIDTDSDGDGESDTVEAGVGTFANQDTDGDGLDDGFEGGTANDPFDVNDELDNGASDTNNDDVTGTPEVDFREITDIDLVVNKMMVESGPYAETFTYSYRIILTNNGPSLATNVSITDVLPTQVSYVSDTALGAYDPISGVWTVGAMNSGDSVTLDIEFLINPGTASTVVTNTISNVAVDQKDLNLTADDLEEVFIVDGDFDQDGVSDSVDQDSDNDGILDVEEQISGVFTDTDGDGILDIFDVDSDGDGIFDMYEAGHNVTDSNGNGMLEGPVSSDGVPDSVQNDPDGGAVNYQMQDTDGDLTNDYLDVDDDGDTILTIDENPDPNADGNPIDAIDTDKNGIPDYLDPNTVDVSVEDGIEIYAGISPNGDGINDKLVIRGLENVENSFELFNRWGVKVYETKDYGLNNNFFTGISTGRTTIQENQELPVGTYYYFLRYTLPNGEPKTRGGYIYINR
ncbi:gliding motility-associated C-terminal domain-containing protein [Aquimarina sp. W85]|uniref:T9SS type B sorting domain-containing protein n=1 Tax=Aquimarina rhodophyticola TaxID=3342246 RepID=UPI00366E6991